MPVMEEFGIGSGLGIVTGVGVGASSASSILDISESVPTMDSAPTLDSSSGGSSGLGYLQSCGSANEFVEVDIGGAGTGVGGSRVISPPPHLSMSFGSWNSNSSKGRGSGASKRSGGMDPGTDPGPGSKDRGHGEEDEGHRRLSHHQQHQHIRDTMDNHTTTTSVQAETAREGIGGHFRKASGSPISWASPARGTLFIVNYRNSEDL